MGRRDSSDDGAKEKDCWKQIARGVQDLMARAIPNVEAILDDKEGRWDDRTKSDVASIDLVKLSVGIMKAREQAQHVTAALGLVVVTPRVETTAQWERMAQMIEEGKEIIDVDSQPVLSVPAKEDPK